MLHLTGVTVLSNVKSQYKGPSSGLWNLQFLQLSSRKFDMKTTPTY